MNAIGVFFAEGMEEVEALTAVDILRRAGIETVTISISRQRQVVGSHGIRILADQMFEEASFEALDGLVLPGGMPGTKNLQEHMGVGLQVRAFYEQEKLVAAICAAPIVLGRAGILEGKRAVCYPGYEDQLAGAKVGSEKVIRDGNIITSRGMGTAVPFGLSLVEYFLGKEKALEIKESILYGHSLEASD